MYGEIGGKMNNALKNTAKELFLLMNSTDFRTIERHKMQFLTFIYFINFFILINKQLLTIKYYKQ